MRRKVKCAALMTVMLTGSILLSACKGTEAAEPISFEGSVAEASDIYVAPVAGMSDDFVRGVDISSYLAEI